MVLAEIYAQRGRSELVVSLTKRAIEMAVAAGDAETADELRGRLTLYEESVGNSPP